MIYFLPFMYTTRLGAYKLDEETMTATVDPDLTARAKRFFEVARRANVSLIGEQGPTLEQYEVQLADILNGTVRTFAPMQAQKVEHAMPGLRYAYYEGAWEALPDFATLQPVAEGVCAQPALSVRQNDVNFGLRFTGYIEAPRGGMYTFYLRSNDGSRMYLGDELIVNNDGPHRMETRGGVAVLRPGLHPVTIEYFQMGLDLGLEVSWEGPGIKQELIPAGRFWHEGE